jgi:hypothetical protein
MGLPYQTREGEKRIEDGAQIQALLSPPTTAGRSAGRLILAERLANLGIRIASVSSERMAVDRILSSGLGKPHGVVYTLTNVNRPSAVAGLCPALPALQLLKRGNSWLLEEPEERAASVQVSKVA